MGRAVIKPKHALPLAGVLILPLLVWAAAAPQSRRGSAEHVDWQAVAPDSARAISLTWMGIANYPGADEGSWIQRQLEQRFNLRLEPIFLDWAAYRTRLPLQFTGGRPADVFWQGDPIGVQRMVRQGFVLEIPYELLLQHCPTYVQRLNRFGPEAWLYAHYRGKNWGVPTYAAPAIMPRAGVWRMDWLRRVGIERVPQTLDEVEEAFQRLTHNDPDGNGRHDTFATFPNNYWSLLFSEFFAAENVLPFEFVLRGDRIEWGGNLPEARDVLRRLRRWYREGLIDPDFLTQNPGFAMPTQTMLSGRVGYLSDMSEFGRLDETRAGSLAHLMRQLQPRAELAPSAPLMGSDGVRRARVWGGAAHVLCFGSHLAREPEKVLRVLKMLEAIARDRDLAIEANCGRRGVHWEFDEHRGVYRLPPFDTADAANRQILSWPLGNSFFAACGNPPEFYLPLIPPAEREFDARYRRPEWGIKNVLGKSDVVEAAADYLADLRQLQEKTYARMVRGDLPLEDFDAYVQEWNRRGGQVLLEQANQMLHRRDEIYRRVGREDEAPFSRIQP